jgi:basic membrane protein A and related proteins
MSKKIYSLLALLLMVSLILAACGPAATPEAPAPEEPAAPEEPVAPPAATIKACQVTDTGGVDDASFNQTSWEGRPHG